MKAAEFVRKVRNLGKRRNVEVRFLAQRGKGSHATLYYGFCPNRGSGPET